MAALFHVPIATGGRFECTSPAERVYLLSFESPPDNRLTNAFNEAFLIALDLIELKFPKGVVVTTSKIEKFYSNGLQISDLGEPGVRSAFFAKSLYPLLNRLLTYPMPTIALINGHCFAGGLIVAMHHDYRIQNPSKGFLCMNEVLFGAQMDPPLLSIFRLKTFPRIYRSLILEGARFPASAALSAQLVDALGSLPETLKFIEGRDLKAKGDKGVYGGLKEEMWREQVVALTGGLERGGSATWAGGVAGRRVVEESEMRGRVGAWERRMEGQGSGSKL